MTWQPIMTIPRNKEVMIQTGSGLEVTGKVSASAQIQRLKSGKLSIEGYRLGMKNKHGRGSIRVAKWKPLSETNSVQPAAKPAKPALKKRNRADRLAKAALPAKTSITSEKLDQLTVNVFDKLYVLTKAERDYLDERLELILKMKEHFGGNDAFKS